MYIRRKVFSLLQDENGEERYFSTTDITLEDAEQRIFSLNEYDEEEQREYADKKKEGKLTLGDKISIALNKHLTTKKDKEAAIEALEKGKYGKLAKQSAKYGAAGGGLAGAIGGAAIGKKIGGTKGAILGAAIGAAGGGAAGAGGAAAGAGIGGALSKVNRKISGHAQTSAKMEADRIKVAAGKMTKEEFIKKWDRD